MSAQAGQVHRTWIVVLGFLKRDPATQSPLLRCESDVLYLRKRPEIAFFFQAKIPSESFQNAQIILGRGLMAEQLRGGVQNRMRFLEELRDDIP